MRNVKKVVTGKKRGKPGEKWGKPKSRALPGYAPIESPPKLHRKRRRLTVSPTSVST
jgi:hypothetical protein